MGEMADDLYAQMWRTQLEDDDDYDYSEEDFEELESYERDNYIMDVAHWSDSRHYWLAQEIGDLTWQSSTS